MVARLSIDRTHSFVTQGTPRTDFAQNRLWFLDQFDPGSNA